MHAKMFGFSLAAGDSVMTPVDGVNEGTSADNWGAGLLLESCCRAPVTNTTGEVPPSSFGRKALADVSTLLALTGGGLTLGSAASCDSRQVAP